MKVMFIDQDPVTRGLIHCMATMAGIDHAIMYSGSEALELLRGRGGGTDVSWQVCGSKTRDVRLVVTDLVLPDMRGEDLAAIIRVEFPDIAVFAHTESEFLMPGDLFDRIFYKPHGTEAVVRAALEQFGSTRDAYLFSSMIPHVDNHAA